MNVINKKIDEIVPYWRNPRKNDEAVDSVAESIKEFGYAQPIIVDKDNIIIAGHTRYKALKKLGYEEVPVIVSDMNEEQAQGYRIIDNKTSEKAKWDLDKLLPEMRMFAKLPNFITFFPELQIEVPVFDATTITQTNIDNMIDQQAKKFADSSQTFKTYTCPHCGESFDVSA